MLPVWIRGTYVLHLQVGKQVRGDCSASSSPCAVSGFNSCRLPVIDVTVKGRVVKGLVDTGCSNTVAKDYLVDNMKGPSSVRTFSGENVLCEGTGWLRMNVHGTDVCVEATGTKKMLAGVDVIIGMDVIDMIGPMIVDFEMRKIPASHVAATVKIEKVIEDKDFVASFDGKKWTVEWKWKENVAPVLSNNVDLYDNGMSPETRVF